MDPQQTPQRTALSTILIPLTIVIGFGMIAAALFFTRTTDQAPTVTLSKQTEEPATKNGQIRPVDGTDHILGNPNASLLIVEYGDFDCPFCKNFQVTMNRIMDEYGPDGRVAWVYRHLPIEKLHPNAQKIALASECIADLGGNKAFWDFADLVYTGRNGTAPTNITNLNRYAKTVGVDVQEFNQCINENRFIDRVNADKEEAIAAGAKGTPYSFIIVGDQQGPIEGALPYNGVRQLINTLLVQIDGLR